METEYSEGLSGYATEVMRQVDVMNYFKDYREKGTRPFYTITHFVGAVSDNHFEVMEAIIIHLL